MPSAKTQIFPIVLSDTPENLTFLALGQISAYLRTHEGGALLDTYIVNRVQLGCEPQAPISEILEAVAAAEAPICLLSSYVWNHSLNMSVAARIKELNPGATIISGGPEIPKYVGKTEAFLDAHPFIDIAVIGEGEVAAAEVLERLAGAESNEAAQLGDVHGIVFRSSGELVRTAERQRMKDLDILPSPYLSGEFEPWFRDRTHSAIETNRGCPYGCVYCDWGSATLQKIARFSFERVVKDIEYLAERKTRSVFIADANFGILEQDVRIAKELAASRARTGYPKVVYVNFAKNGGKHLMAVIKVLHEGGLMPSGIVALQTTDERVLKVIKRSNIKTSSYEKMMEYFNAENIPMSSDILVGLPGQTIDVLEKDLQFCVDWKVSVNANNVSMMPNAPMADDAYRRENEIVVDDGNMVMSTSTFSADDLEYMKALLYAYLFHIRFGISRYVLYFLQVDHGVPVMKLVRRWLDAALRDDAKAPISSRVLRQVIDPGARPRHWFVLAWGRRAGFLFKEPELFYEELISLAEREFDVSVGPTERQAIIAAQAAVMPKRKQQYPRLAEMEHDAVSYFDQLREVACLTQESFRPTPLRDFAPGSMKAGTEGLEFESIAHSKLHDAHNPDVGWEVESKMRFDIYRRHESG